MEKSLDLYTLDDLRNYPEPEWLITDHIHKEDVAVIWGQPSSGKSFLALDWALSIASGLPWLGQYAVAKAPILYMAGEGASSIHKRVQAWMEPHDVTAVPGAYFHLRPLPLLEEEVIEEIQTTLSSYCRHEADPELGLGLIVVDTLSQFFGNGDEVSPDMTQFVNNMRRIAHESHTAVLIVHHSNAVGERERGHGSLRGNLEAAFEVKAIKKDGRLIGLTLVNDKQKDDPENLPMKLSLYSSQNSLAISLGDSSLSQKDEVKLTDKSLENLLTTIETFESEKTESSSHAAMIEALGWHKPTFHRRLDKLKKLKLVTGAGRGKSALTLTGRNTLVSLERSI